MDEMRNLVQSIVKAVTPETTDDETINNITDKISTSARTLSRCAEAQVESLKTEIKEKSELIANTGAATLMFDHQKIRKGADVETVSLK